MQILTCAAKVVVLTTNQQLALLQQYLFSIARYDRDYDVRDRGRYLSALLRGVSALPSDEEDMGGVVLRREQVKLVLLGQRDGAAVANKAETYDVGTLSALLKRRLLGYEALPDWTDDPTDSGLRDSQVSTCLISLMHRLSDPKHPHLRPYRTSNRPHRCQFIFLPPPHRSPEAYHKMSLPRGLSKLREASFKIWTRFSTQSRNRKRRVKRARARMKRNLVGECREFSFCTGHWQSLMIRYRGTGEQDVWGASNGAPGATRFGSAAVPEYEYDEESSEESEEEEEEETETESESELRTQRPLLSNR